VISYFEELITREWGNGNAPAVEDSTRVAVVEPAELESADHQSVQITESRDEPYEPMWSFPLLALGYLEASIPHSQGAKTTESQNGGGWKGPLWVI